MGNSASSLPYSIGKQVNAAQQQQQQQHDGWAIHEGSRKSDNAPVTVFVAKKPALSKAPVDRTRSPQFTQLGAAIHHFQYAKRLRHPQVLQVLAMLDTDNPTDDGSSHHGAAAAAAAAASHGASTAATKETGDLIIVTEPCVPLDEWLAQSGPNKPTLEQVAWGLESVVRALHFLHSSANLSHGNVSPRSLFVTRAGDVKLWNFSLVTPVTEGLSLHFKDYEALLTPTQYRAPERVESRWNDITTGGVHAMDSFSVGVLVPSMFGGASPPLLQKAVQRMMTSNVKMRPRLQPLLKCPIFGSPYQNLQLQLEELAIQPVEQKISFWHHVNSILVQPSPQQAVVPEALAVYKLLPIIQSSIHTIADSESLRGQDMYRRELMALLPPFFFVLEKHLGTDTAAVGTPKNVETVASLFRVNDRGVRGTLLQKMRYLSQVLDAAALNNHVFEPMCSGFSDSSSALRELTLKATLGLVPHLTQPNLEKLSRYLVRLQSDPEPSIRTNTVIFFSKLAPHLTETTRQKQLLPAFVRSLKDPFTPCRLATLKSVLQAKEFFTPAAIATSVLPVVTPQLLDPVAEVRREAFLVVDDLIFLLRQESARMPSQPPNSDGGAVSAPHAPSPASAPAPPQASAVAPAPASGGYLSGLSSWVTSAAAAAPAPAPAPAPTAPASSAPHRQPAPLPAQPQLPAAPHVNAMHIPTNQLSSLALQNSSSWGDNDGDGWDDPDDDDDDDDVMMGGGSARSARDPKSPVASSGGGRAPGATSLFAAPANEDELFGSLGAPRGRSAVPIAAARNRGAKLAVPASAAAKPSVTKLSVEDDPVDDGWDDF